MQRIFYHGDLDGQASGYAVFDYLCRCGVEPAHYIKLREIDYTNPITDSEIDELLNDDVWVVDFGLPEKTVNRIQAKANHFVWIDHHKTTPSDQTAFTDVLGLRRTDEAACLLTWKYVNWYLKSDWTEDKSAYPNASSLECDEVPFVLRLVSDFDTFTWEYGNETLYFQNACLVEDTEPYSVFWGTCIHSGKKWWNELMNQGHIIERYRNIHHREYAERAGYSMEWEGMTCLFVNTAFVQSYCFRDFADDYDVVVPHCYDGKQWKVSLYAFSDFVDVSEVAKKFGGGGHKGAAGFQCDILPWLEVGNRLDEVKIHFDLDDNDTYTLKDALVLNCDENFITVEGKDFAVDKADVPYKRATVPISRVNLIEEITK